LLRRTGGYQRLKASWVYTAYWSVCDRRVIDDRRREIEFYRNVLHGFREGDLIFDVGANVGYKTDIFLRLGAKVVSVEPDETSQQILRERFLDHRLKRKPLVITPMAVGERNSVERMWIDEPGSAKNTLSRKWAETLRADDKRFGHRLSFGRWKDVETTTIERLITTHGLPFFVKIDVEGYELAVLRGIQRPVPYLSFEANLPEFRSEALECVQVLDHLASDGMFNYTPDCRHGLVLERWCGTQDFRAVLDSCRDECIEVFWTTPISKG